MGNFLFGFVLPLLLLTASLINWSLISLVDLIAFLLVQFNTQKIGFRFQRRYLLLWPILVFSLLVIFSQVVFLILWGVKGNQLSIADDWWAKLIGFMIIESWKSPAIFFLVVQLLAVSAALIDIYGRRFGLVPWKDSCWGRILTIAEHLGSRLRFASCLVLPAVQLVVGISHPSWVSLPFFIGSCVGLVDWSMTSNFLGLFRWWRPLQLYAGFNIVLLYVYQFPIEFPRIFQWIADFIGLFKISAKSEWPEIFSGVSLILFYIMVAVIGELVANR